jgi:hypothetical protein
MTDHDIDITPGHVIELLNEFNCEYFDNQFEIDQNNEKKYLKLKTKDNLEVKITFFDLHDNNNEDEEEP